MSLRVSNGGRSGGVYLGPGGYNYWGISYPYQNRACDIVNNSGADLFIPTGSQQEMTDVYNNIGQVSGVTVYYGSFVDAYGYLRNDQVGYNEWCWNHGYGGNAPTPGGCPSGFNSGPVFEWSGGYIPEPSYTPGIAAYGGARGIYGQSMNWTFPSNYEPGVYNTDSYGHQVSYPYGTFSESDLTNDVWYQYHSARLTDTYGNQVINGANPEYLWWTMMASYGVANLGPIQTCPSSYPYGASGIRICYR
jgi:hypothetical protein